MTLAHLATLLVGMFCGLPLGVGLVLLARRLDAWTRRRTEAPACGPARFVWHGDEPPAEPLIPPPLRNRLPRDVRGNGRRHS